MGTQPPTTYTTRLLDAGTWNDFSALVEDNNGVWGGCWCMGFHPEGVGQDRTPDQNREAKRELAPADAPARTGEGKGWPGRR